MNKENKKQELIAFNSYGGFSKNGDEYHILNPKTPLPWCNVLANENFGTVISTHGTVYTYFENSREYKITNWCNDWTDVTPGETFEGIFDGSDYNLIYGFGYVKVLEETEEINKSMDIFIPVNDNVKVQNIRLENKKSKVLEYKITYTLDPVLGVSSEVDSSNIITKFKNETIIFKNPYSKSFADSCSYLTVAVDKEKNNKTKINVEYDVSDFKVTITTKLKAGGSAEFAILLGALNNKDTEKLNKSCEEIISDVKDKYSLVENINLEYSNVKEYWRDKVKRDVTTEDEYVNIMARGWLMYQTICCRLYAKTAFYQSGGAVGYRDQLQDTMALISAWPEKTRSQIVLHASKQFEKGDVLHWWHQHTGAGIRTYFSDDYLWLPYVLCEYVEKTKDVSVLDELTPYLQSRDMGQHRELYEVFYNSNVQGTVYEHAKKAITYSLSRIDLENGLSDIGDGDWNDGFSNIRGQSVWLTFFVMDILEKFIKLAEIKKDFKMIEVCSNYRTKLKDAVCTNAYEEEHFVRAFFENGEVLGSFTNEECKVDLISQAWAAIALKDFKEEKEKIDKALNIADKYLVDRENKIVKLLYPPFNKPKNNPGYIKSYVPGVRENGGQYTHASTWLAKAYFELNRHEEGLEILKFLCPIYHSNSKEEADKYMVEPYVLAADVYANDEHVGRGGWTWYTGSAAWYYKVIEDEYNNKKDSK